MNKKTSWSIALMDSDSPHITLRTTNGGEVDLDKKEIEVLITSLAASKMALEELERRKLN